MNWFWQKYETHPYYFSGGLVMAFSLAFLFALTPIGYVDDKESVDVIEFVNLDTIPVSKRVFKKQISTEEGEVSEDTNQARGDKETEYKDLSFFSNVVQPKLLSRLPDNFPALARQKEVEATVFLNLYISSKGVVKRVLVRGVKLSKTVPPGLAEKLKTLFAKAAVQGMTGLRYSTGLVDGKPADVIAQMNLNYKLKN